VEMEASPITTAHYQCLFFRVEEDRGGNDAVQDALLTIPDDGLSSLEVIDLHLTWQHFTTLYTSFFSSWRKVLRRRQWLASRGSPHLRIIIIDSQNLGQVVDARQAALQLGYDDNCTDPRRQLRYFWNEYLVENTVSLYEDAVLAVIPADGHEVTVYDRGRPIPVPSAFWDTRQHTSIRDKFKTRLYERVGSNDKSF
jgi:hypothetical protein